MAYAQGRPTIAMTTRSPMTDMGLIANGLAFTVGSRIGDCRRSTSSAPGEARDGFMVRVGVRMGMRAG